MAKTYFISFNGVDYSEFFPSNRPKVTNVQQPDEKFIRSRVDLFSIPRNTNKTVVDSLDSFFFDNTKFGTTLKFKIKKSGVDKYLFRMSVNEGDFDDERKVFNCTPRPDDDYQDILDLYETILVDNEEDELYGFTRTLFILERDQAGDFVKDPPAGGYTFTDVAKTVTWDNGSGGVAYASKGFAGVAGANNVTKVTVVNKAGNNFKIYLASVGGTPLSNSVTVTGDTVAVLTQTGAPAPSSIFLEFANGDSGSFDYIDFQPIQYNSSGSLLDALIERLLTSADYLNLGAYTGNVVSTYLWNDALGSDPPPNIDAYIGSNPANDYVIEGAAVWNYTRVVKTHRFTTEKNPTFKMTFKDLMDFLKIKLRAWWHLDEDGKFRIEHEKYYRDFATQLNVTTAPETSDKPEVDVSLFNYEKGDIFGTLNYSENNANNQDFISEPILYDNEITTPNKLDIPIVLSTDVEFIIDTDNSVDNNGLSMLQCIRSGTNDFVDINVSYYDAEVYWVNQRLSWAHVMDNYFGYFAEAGAGTVNTDAKNFDGVKEFLKQTDIKFYYDGELDWRKPVTLNNGLAWLEQWDESEDDFLTINVGYDPYL